MFAKVYAIMHLMVQHSFQNFNFQLTPTRCSSFQVFRRFFFMKISQRTREKSYSRAHFYQSINFLMRVWVKSLKKWIVAKSVKINMQGYYETFLVLKNCAKSIFVQCCFLDVENTVLYRLNSYINLPSK